VKRIRLELLGFLVTLVAALAFLHCAKREEAFTPAPSAADAGAAFDVETMAFLSKARALHHLANVKESAGDLPGAIDAMEQLVRAPRPHPAQKVPEIEEVVSDAYARLAELRLAAGDLDGAQGAIREGLLHAPDPTYFRGHLLEVQGILEETRGAMLADAGKSEEAAKARARAMALLQEAVHVQDQVIDRALGDAGKR
jgi:tetratricopeptide (TPR) repeat protein